MCYPSRMRIIPFVLGALLLQVPAKADKFWLSDPENQKKAAEGSTPDVVVGVLIAESDEGYHVRIVGGEVILPKKSVRKIEKDDLSIDTIVKMEKDQAQQRDAAEKERQMAASAAQRARDVKAVEATAKRAATVAAAPAPAPARTEVQAPGFDPVIGVYRSAQEGNRNDLQREVQMAWTLTRDTRYLRLLRQLRRMR